MLEKLKPLPNQPKHKKFGYPMRYGYKSGELPTFILDSKGVGRNQFWFLTCPKLSIVVKYVTHSEEVLKPADVCEKAKEIIRRNLNQN